jgi:hypothetical protein
MIPFQIKCTCLICSFSHRKYDVEPMFGRMKSIFGVRRTHLRGKQPVENELGILLMTMNLTKLAGILTKAAVNFPR